MSTTTDVLSLFKYDPVADADSTFNITQGLNNNWDKIDTALLLAIAAAGAYNPEESYAVGDYCTYKGKLRKCSTAIPTGETWTEAHWTTTTVAAELAELSSQLSKKAEWMPNNWKTEADAPSAYPLNSATTFFSGNSFAGIDQCIVTTYAYNLNAARQIVSFLDNTGVKYRLAIGEDQWGAWKQISTATPPQTGSLQFESGFYAVYPIAWTRNQFGEIHVGGVVAYDGLQNMIANDVVVATLPVGYRPSVTLERPATFQNISDGTRFAGTVSINSSGEIVFYLVGTATYAIFDADFSV